MNEEIKIHGDLGPDPAQSERIIDKQVYDLRDHLLAFHSINMVQAHTLYKIGHLPRRISDLIEYLAMDIKRDRWYKWSDKNGKKRHVKEYYITPESADNYMLNSMHLTMPWAKIYAARKLSENFVREPHKQAC
jgi:hypothetical protein